MDEDASAGGGRRLDEDAFCQYLEGSLGLAVGSVSAHSGLGQDLELDSLGMYELVVVLEDIGLEISEDDLFSIITVGDAYSIYSSCAERS